MIICVCVRSSLRNQFVGDDSFFTKELPIIRLRSLSSRKVCVNVLDLGMVNEFDDDKEAVAATMITRTQIVLLRCGEVYFVWLIVGFRLISD